MVFNLFSFSNLTAMRFHFPVAHQKGMSAKELEIGESYLQHQEKLLRQKYGHLQEKAIHTQGLLMLIQPRLIYSTLSP